MATLLPLTYDSTISGISSDKLSNENSKAKSYLVEIAPPAIALDANHLATVTEYSSTARVGAEMANAAKISDGESRSVAFYCCDEDGVINSRVDVELWLQHAPSPNFESHPFEFEIGFSNIEKYFDEILGDRLEKLAPRLGLEGKDRLFELKERHSGLVSKSN